MRVGSCYPVIPARPYRPKLHCIRDALVREWVRDMSVYVQMPTTSAAHTLFELSDTPNTVTFMLSTALVRRSRNARRSQ